ncbi:diacylglycerol kinase [Paenibacillus selenitireducens]|jgi:undecaprenol kinase|uniref:Diacylglycerol kinase n=1 Tax=Paenibacillus selenitireducens TaxID=1324314 RepID=A0A1T2XEU6_9BACL|nr:diacylglycerol kinase family protein [Paenibacillus selenitireducens]OPA78414.1 diacylglycerol kinase [Paenibacillus selenitireducens]
MSPTRYSENRFKVALTGVLQAIREERHMPFHIAMGILMVIAGWFFSISKVEWLVLLLTIALVITTELMNTAIERTVDLVTEEIHPLAKSAKDIAAGAVIVTAAFAVIIGIIIFYTPVMDWLQQVWNR